MAPVVEVIGDARLRWLEDYAEFKLPGLRRVTILNEGTVSNMADLLTIRLLDSSPLDVAVILPGLNDILDINYSVYKIGVGEGPRSAILRSHDISTLAADVICNLTDMVERAHRLRPGVTVLVGTIYGIKMNRANMDAAGNFYNLNKTTTAHQKFAECTVYGINRHVVRFNNARGVPTPRIDSIVHNKNPLTGKWVHSYQRLYLKHR